MTKKQFLKSKGYEEHIYPGFYVKRILVYDCFINFVEERYFIQCFYNISKYNINEIIETFNTLKQDYEECMKLGE